MSLLAGWSRQIWLLALLVGTLLARSGVRWLSLELRGAPSRRSRRAVRWRAFLARSGIRTTLRWLVYVGIPYVALLSGLLFPHELGLVWPSREAWRQTLPPLAGLTLLSMAVFVHAASTWDATTPPPESLAWRAPFGLFLFWPDILLVHTHWAFYRAIGLAFGAGSRAMAVGVLLVLLEWLLDPAWWRRMQRPHLALHPLFRVQSLFIAAVGFALSGSALPALAFHLLLEPLLFGGLFFRPPTLASRQFPNT